MRTGKLTISDRLGSRSRSRDSWSRSSSSAQRANCELAMRYSSECHSSPARTSWLSARSISSQPVVTAGILSLSGLVRVFLGGKAQRGLAHLVPVLVLDLERPLRQLGDLLVAGLLAH